MKVIKCELCGNNQLVKQGDYFVCQFCGTKYAPEAAKKLIVDIASPVSIDGAVEVTSGDADKTRLLQNLNTLFELNQRHDFMEKLKIAMRDYPDEWKVWFLAFKSRVAWEYVSSLRRLDGSYILFLDLRDCWFSNQIREREIMTAKKVCPSDQLTELEKSYLEIFDQLISKINNRNLCIITDRRFLTYDYAFENKNWINCMTEYDYECEKAAATIKSELSEYKKNALISLKIRDRNFSFSGESIEKIMYFDGTGIGNTVFTDDSYERPNTPSFYVTPEQFIKCVKEQNSTSGCYIATCVYGSYDCPEVWRLRRFRDSVLSKTWRGRLFIRTYYAISPKLVKWFGETVWFKRIWKSVIDKIGLDLKNKGFDDTPYTDE